MPVVPTTVVSRETPAPSNTPTNDEGGKLFLIKMNTCIQVDHPVTEMNTGIDLVRATISIAQGQPLERAQADVTKRGAIDLSADEATLD